MNFNPLKSLKEIFGRGERTSLGLTIQPLEIGKYAEDKKPTPPAPKA